MVPVIAASVDPQNQGSSPHWHILEPNGKPLCNARLSGKMTTSKKGTPTCSLCKKYDYPSVYDKGRAILLRLDSGEAMKAMPKRAEAYEIYSLEDMRLVTIDQANYAVQLTDRGRVAIMDLKAPAMWKDDYGIVHSRRWLADRTRCNEHTGIVYCADLAALHKQAKRQGLAKVTCLECISQQMKYDAVEA